MHINTDKYLSNAYYSLMNSEILQQCVHARPQHTENIIRLFDCSPFFVSLMQGSDEETCFDLFVPKERCLLPHQRKECMPQMNVEMSLKQTMQAMRQCKRKGLRHTLWWELGVGGSVLRSACSLSLWADHFLQAAIIKAQHVLQAEVGHIEDGRFCIIGLGQLGGLELHVHSELKLLFVWDAASQYSSGDEPVTAQTYYARLSQLVIQMMATQTEDGVVWPIEVQLCPHENADLICIQLDTALRHYQYDAQTWERLMLTKARTVAGNLDLGDVFLDKLQAFVYRDYMDYSTVQDLHAMKKRMIETIVTTEVQAGFNLKYGCGAVREIEFKIQALQLLHGKRYPQLQQTNSMDALTALQKAGLLSQLEVQNLHRSYVVWRTIKHALQIRFGESQDCLTDDYEAYLLQAIRLECPQLIMQTQAKSTHRYFLTQFMSVVQHEVIASRC